MAYNVDTLPEKPILTDQQIQALLNLPKAITKKTPATEVYREENNQKRCDLELEALSDDGAKFLVFIRQSRKFIENFSIGLRYQTNIKSLGTITLIRYNGPHGESSWQPDGHYAKSHIHRITERELESGKKEPQEKYREITDRYCTFEQALTAFFDDLSVVDYVRHFPELRNQLGLDLKWTSPK